MIEALINSFTALSTAVYYIFLLSYKMGQLIIGVLSYAAHLMRIIWITMFTLLNVISEDFCIFLIDVVHHIDVIISAILGAIVDVVKPIYIIVDALKCVVSNIYSVILMIPSNIAAGILNAFTNVIYLFSIFKRLLILFGSGMWFALTLFPLFILYSLSLCVYFIGSVFEELKDLIQNGTAKTYEHICNMVEFATDVPFEAVAGFTFGCCIFYVVLKFHLIMYRVLKEKFRLLARYLNLNVSRLRHRLQIKRDSSNSNENDSTNTEASRNKMYDSRYCIICQEHYKCILMLPCKHVCLCNECNNRLSYFDNTCPLCRCEVKKTMKIFV